MWGLQITKGLHVQFINQEANKKKKHHKQTQDLTMNTGEFKYWKGKTKYMRTQPRGETGTQLSYKLKVKKQVQDKQAYGHIS